MGGDGGDAAAHLREEVFGGFPKSSAAGRTAHEAEVQNGVNSLPVTLTPEPGVEVSAVFRIKTGVKEAVPAAVVLLHPDGKARR